MSNYELNRQMEFVLDKEQFDFFKDKVGSQWVTVSTEQNTETMLVLSDEFSRYLQHTLFSDYGQRLKLNDLQNFLDLLHTELKHYRKLESKEVTKRVGVSKSAEFVYKLDDVNFVKYSEKKVEIVRESEVKFKPIKLKAQTLPKLENNGANCFEWLAQFFNCSLEQQVILLAYILYSFVNVGKANQAEIPILIFCGDVNSGKTTALKVLRAIISPEATSTELITNEDNLALLSSNSFLTIIDDCKSLKPVMQDTIFKIIENGTKTIPAKYKDNEPVHIELGSILVLAGYEEEILKNVRVLERGLVLKLQTLETAKSIDVVMDILNKQKADILGSLFNFLPNVLEKFNSNKKNYNTRFGNFLKFGVAVADCLKNEYEIETDFIECYNNLINEQKSHKLKADEVLNVLVEYIMEETCFNGTATNLNLELTKFASENCLDYKGYEANILSRKINSNLSLLKEFNIEVEYNKGEERIINICTVEAENVKAFDGDDSDAYVVPQYYSGCAGCENFDFNDGESCLLCSVIDEFEIESQTVVEVEEETENWELETMIFSGFDFENDFCDDYDGDILDEVEEEYVGFSSTKTKKNRVFNVGRN